MISKIEDLIYKPDMPSDVKARKIMVVGAGEIIKDAQLPAYRLAGYDVAGIYNRTRSKAEALANEFQIPMVYDDLQKMIADGTAMHAVFDIALPASINISILKQLPDYTPVLIQKPMGENIEEAKAILDVCRQKHLVAGINFQLREAPYIIAAKKLIDDGVIGEICDFEIRETVFTPWHLWKFLYSVDRMEINYHSIHFVDVMRYFLGEPKKVMCKTMKHPKSMELAQVKSNMIFDYGDTLRAGIITNHNHEFGLDEQECFLKIEGTKGALKITMGVYLDYPVGLPDKFRYISLEDHKGWRDLKVPGSWFPEAFIGTMGGLMKKLEDPSFHFINDVEDAYKTMCTVEACYESNKLGGVPVKYPE